MTRHLLWVAALCAALILAPAAPATAQNTAQPSPCPIDDDDEFELPDIIVPGLGTW